MQLQVLLKSDATFARGDGVAGLVDLEVEHDSATGLPFIRGRVLKGLLVEECANIFYALEAQGSQAVERLIEPALFLFGQAGSTLSDDALMSVGPAVLPKDASDAVVYEINSDASSLTPADVLESLTVIRRQTAVDESKGVPEKGSLRSTRAVIRETPFYSNLTFFRAPNSNVLALLSACVLSLRRGGVNRNRGQGRLRVRLIDGDGVDVTMSHFNSLRNIINGGAE